MGQASGKNVRLLRKAEFDSFWDIGYHFDCKNSDSDVEVDDQWLSVEGALLSLEAFLSQEKKAKKQQEEPQRDTLMSYLLKASNGRVEINKAALYQAMVLATAPTTGNEAQSRWDLSFSLDVQLHEEFIEPPRNPLTSLELSLISIDDEQATLLAGALPRELERVDLHQNSLTSNNALVAALCQLPRLHTLCLDANELTECTPFGRLLDSNATIQHLDLRSNRLGSEHRTQRDADVHFREMCDALAKNRTLEFLSIESNGLNEDDGSILAAALRVNMALKTLKISRNRGLQGAEEVLRAVAISPTMEKLVASCINAPPVEAIRDLFRMNDHLFFLDLRDNEMTVEHGEAIATGLRTNSTIHTLWISSNYFSRACEEILLALEHNDTLGILIMEGNNGWSPEPRFTIDNSSLFCFSPLPTISQEFKDMIARNLVVSKKVRAAVIFLMAMRKFHPSDCGPHLGNVPFDIMKMISQWVWRTRRERGVWG